MFDVFENIGRIHLARRFRPRSAVIVGDGEGRIALTDKAGIDQLVDLDRENPALGVSLLFRDGSPVVLGHGNSRQYSLYT